MQGVAIIHSKFTLGVNVGVNGWLSLYGLFFPLLYINMFIYTHFNDFSFSVFLF